MSYISKLPLFITYFVLLSYLLGAFIVGYASIMPHNQLKLIRDGDTAAAIQLVGGSIGFSIALASIAIHNVSRLDALIWGMVALLVQISTSWVVSEFFENLRKCTEANRYSSSIFVGGISLCVGILQAACMVQ